MLSNLMNISRIKKKITNLILKENALPLFINQKKLFKNSIKFNICTFGNKNRDKVFYVIRRSPGAGLFSNVIYVLNHLQIAEQNNFIPIVDMENFTTIYNEKEKIDNTYNAWEYYFEKINKYSLKDVYKSQNVILGNNTFYKCFSHNILEQKFYRIGKKYIKIKKNIIQEAKNFCKNNLDSNTLAIHYRGTSYKTSANHPYPATTEQSLEYINFLIKKYDYKKIFLCTEDLTFFNAMKNEFKSNLFYINSFRSSKDNAFKIYPRKQHRYKLGLEILQEALIISKCQGFLHSITNVSMYVKYLDNKKKLKYFTLNNGINTSNEFIAPYTWFYKKIFPEVLGGFKKKIF
jgi:hypothetical protein